MLPQLICSSRTGHRAASCALQAGAIREALNAMQMVDVGCGIGGSSRYISRKFGCTAQGITLSPVQVLTCNLAFFLLAQHSCDHCLCQPARSAVSPTLC